MFWDEIQPTVVGRAEPHNLRLVHPGQDRVVTLRENARCQVAALPPLPLSFPMPPSLLLSFTYTKNDNSSWERVDLP